MNSDDNNTQPQTSDSSNSNQNITTNTDNSPLFISSNNQTTSNNGSQPIQSNEIQNPVNQAVYSAMSAPKSLNRNRILVIAGIVVFIILAIIGIYFGYTKLFNNKNTNLFNSNNILSEANSKTNIEEVLSAMKEGLLYRPGSSKYKSIGLSESLYNDSYNGYGGFETDWDSTNSYTKIKYKNLFSNVHIGDSLVYDNDQYQYNASDREYLEHHYQTYSDSYIPEYINDNSYCVFIKQESKSKGRVESWQTSCYFLKVIDKKFYIETTLEGISPTGGKYPDITENEYKSLFHNATKQIIKKISDYTLSNNKF